MARKASCLLILLLVAACASPVSPSLPDGAIRLNGTVEYFNLEGGFWAVRGEDGVTYDPIGGLPPAYQRNSLRVAIVARVRPEMAGIHMVGPIVEILSIEAR
jgi:hypothetical protein